MAGVMALVAKKLNSGVDHFVHDTRETGKIKETTYMDR